MKIAIDLLSLGGGGGEKYVQELLPRLSRSDLSLSVFLTRGRARQLRADLPSHVQVVDVPPQTANPFFRHWFQRYRLPAWLDRMSTDVLFVPGGLTGTRPGRGARFKLVSMLQNMLPFAADQRRCFSLAAYPLLRLRLWLLSFGLLQTFRASDRVIYISEYSRKEVAPLVGKPGPVIPHGTAEPKLGPDGVSAEILDKYGIRRPFLLYVSIFDPYKHQLEVMEGFRRLLKLDPSLGNLQLVLAGPITGTYGRRVLREARGDRNILCCGAIPPSELNHLLTAAELLLFASTCEACPNILLEYFASARPIICSEAGPMPEMGGDAVRYVAAKDPAAWADAIREILTHVDIREDLQEKARKRAAHFSWNETARQTRVALTEW